MNDFDNLDGWVTQLSNRSIISLRGPDSSSFLQGLTTQDMNLFQKEKERASIFTSFMNVKGKTLFDCFICKPLLAHQDGQDVEYWIDVASYDADDLIKHMKVSIVSILMLKNAYRNP